MTETPQIETPHDGAASTHGSATVTNGATAHVVGHNVRSSSALIF
jgi:hypothetical protein